jgi:hypothetical protein
MQRYKTILFIWLVAAPIALALPQNSSSEKSPKDVGVLLGLRESDSQFSSEYRSGEYKSGLYRTLWITRVGDSIRLDQSDNLLVPRSSGFWRLGSNISAYQDYKEEFVWRAPLGEEVHVRELTDAETEGRSDQSRLMHPITFVSGDYIARGVAESGKLRSLHMYEFDDANFQRPLDISSVVGVKAKEALEKGTASGREKHMSAPLSMQSQCLLEASPEKWAVARDRGHWFISGWGIWSDDMANTCSDGQMPDFITSQRAPVGIVGPDELSLSWAQVKKFLPEAIDTVGPPIHSLLIVLTNDEILICPVNEGRIGKALARTRLLPQEKLVMAQWAVGKHVASWNEQFDKFKKSPGPHNPFFPQ